MEPLPVGDAPWWDEAVAVLSEDELLGPIVRAYPSPALSGQGKAFRSVVNAIVGQQISVAAADANGLTVDPAKIAGIKALLAA